MITSLIYCPPTLLGKFSFPGNLLEAVIAFNMIMASGTTIGLPGIRRPTGHFVPTSNQYPIQGKERCWDGNPDINECLLTPAEAVGLLPPFRGGHYLMATIGALLLNKPSPKDSKTPSTLNFGRPPLKLDGLLWISTCSMRLAEMEHTTAYNCLRDDLVPCCYAEARCNTLLTTT